MRPGSLRARLAVWALLLALGAAGVPGLWLTWRAYRALRAEAYDAQLMLARGLASEIDGQLGQAIAAVNALAAEPALARDASRLASRLALLARATESLDDLLVAGADGGLRGRAPFDDAPPRFSRAERARLAAAALKAPAQTVSLVERERDGDLVLRLARALDRRSVVEAQLRLEPHGLGSLEELGLGASGFAYLADEHGRPLVLPSLAKRLRPGAKESLAFDFDGAEFCRAVDAPGGADLLAAAPVDALDWAVAVRRTLSEAEAPARHMRRELIAFTVLALLVSLALALALARPLVAGLEGLAASARNIEAGRPLPPENPRPDDDEVAAVAKALRHLDGSLRRQQAERERAHARALDAERRLARSERLASVGQLTAGLAHELNSPLMVIHGAAAEAAALSPPGARRWLERVRRESERCSRLVRDLLDFARPRPPQRRNFDLAAALQEAFDSARAGRAGAARWTLTRSGGARWTVRADRDQLLQVLINLCANALDAMPAGGALEARLDADAAGWRLRLRDHGPGVPAKQREAVFRPFFSAKPHGTGLGLAIARNLMLGHGGSLRCLPVRGPGACFEAAWPRRSTPKEPRA